MFLGIDFGTSNCAVAMGSSNGVSLLPVEDGRPLLPTLMYLGAEDTEVPLAQRVERASEVKFGRSALEAYIEHPEGHLLRSPKSFLGSKLRPDQLAFFQKIIERFFRYLKAHAEVAAGQQFTGAVVGRPVFFQQGEDHDANAQAEQILLQAAQAAGFTQVEFLLEPIAAALDFERRIQQEHVILVLDSGGGTTDCTMMRLGPERAGINDRQEDVLAVAGIRQGGVDVDIQLSFNEFMPLFGLHQELISGLPTSNQVFWEAVAVNDLNAQQRFYGKSEYLANLPKNIKDATIAARFADLRERRLSHRVVLAAEEAKIKLSTQNAVDINLSVLADKPSKTIRLDHLSKSMEKLLNGFSELINSCIEQASRAPDAVLVTGGSGSSPLVMEYLRQAFPQLSFQTGNMLGSVVSGLGERALILNGNH